MTLPANAPGTIFDHKDAIALAAVLVDYEISLRFNTRAARIEALRAPPDGSGKWRPFTDRTDAWLRGDVARRYRYQLAAGGTARLHYGVESWADSLNEITALNEIDPFILWLEQLPFWDGEPRIDMLLANLFAADATPLAQWASRFLTLGAVQRSYEPGCRLREIPVLFAAQDAGKSALLRSLLPNGTDYDEWFSDSLEFDGSTKERAESMLGRVVVEAAELAGINRASLDKLKAFISRTNDGSVRLAYARRPESMPRRSIIIGSVDKSNCLPNDSAGNTRFVVVTLPRSCHVEPALDAVREQLWAEALDRYQKGERANLPRELKPAAAEIAEVHRHADVITEDAIAAANLTNSDGYKLADIAERTGTVGGSQRVLTTALKNVGFAERRVRVDGKQSRYWFPPPGNLPGFGEGASDGF